MQQLKDTDKIAFTRLPATWFAGTIMLILANSPVSVQADQEFMELDSTQSGYTQLPKGDTSVFIGDSGRVSVGKDFVSCSRFAGVPVPKNADVEEAFIDLSCENCRTDSLRVRICGEYTQPSAPLAEEPFNLSDRTWTRACAKPLPDAGGSLSQERFDITPVLQEIVDAQNWQSGNDLVICFVDNGSRAKNVVSSATRLTATFTTGGVEPPPGGPPDGCNIDTTGNGSTDLSYPDSDGDGYCNFPAGNETFLGTLVVDQSFEITEGVSNGVAFQGGQIRLVDGGEIISDFESPVVLASSKAQLPLEFDADSEIALVGGMISNLGSSQGESHDITLRTDFPGSKVRISGPLILGRNLDVESSGAVDIDGETVIGVYGNVKIIAMSTTENDITLGGQALVYTSNQIRFVNNSSSGRVVIGEGVALYATSIDFCGVAGGASSVVVDPGADLRGTILMRGDAQCPK